MRCVNCGLSLRPDDIRCPRCGGALNNAPSPPPPTPPTSHTTPTSDDQQPPATRSGPGVPAVVVGLLVLVVVAVGITVAVKRHPAAAAAQPAPPAVGSSAAAPFFPSTVPSSQPAPSSTDAEQPTDEASAKATLDNEVNSDRATAESMVDHWVPQLSSKRPGLVADGITYDYLHIWANFQQLRTQFPTALLIRSGDYVSFKSTDFYVTVVPQPFADGATANQWCDDAGLAPDDCYAKFLSHQGGSANTTLLRN